jgi:hypothetical protein
MCPPWALALRLVLLAVAVMKALVTSGCAVRCVARDLRLVSSCHSAIRLGSCKRFAEEQEQQDAESARQRDSPKKKPSETPRDLPGYFAMSPPVGVGSAVDVAGCGGYGGPGDGRMCGEVCGEVCVLTSSFGSSCGCGHEFARAYDEVATKAELPGGSGRGDGRGGRRRRLWW